MQLMHASRLHESCSATPSREPVLPRVQHAAAVDSRACVQSVQSGVASSRCMRARATRPGRHPVQSVRAVGPPEGDRLPQQQHALRLDLLVAGAEVGHCETCIGLVREL